MRLCAWCRQELATAKGRFCGRKCRQSAFRLRRRRGVRGELELELGLPPIRVCYADPPYPGRARKYYGREETYGGEVDHAALIRELVRDFPDGWALSTAADALREVLALCPEGAHLCPWVKPIGVPRATKGLHTTWEALIVVGGRQRAPGVRDWLCAQPARFGGTLVGRKPLAFCSFLFDALGLVPGDELVDKYPGTGNVLRAWHEISPRTSGPVLPSTPVHGPPQLSLEYSGRRAS